MSTLLSVMIPVYKAEQTLNRCLNSILPQLPPDGEIILVDDGSPDGSGALCDRWAVQDGRIQAIHQPNGGASAARNAALQRAQGQYLQFVDADDELLPGIYDAVLPRLESGAQVCFFACRDEGRDAPNEVIAPVECSGLTGLGKAEIERYLFSTGVFFAPYNKIFSRELWLQSDARFDTRLPVNEDVAFNFSLLPCCTRLAMLPDCFYLLHVDSSESLSRSFRTDLYSSALLVLPGLQRFLATAGFSGQEQDQLCLRFQAQAACHQFSIYVSREGAANARRDGLKALLSDPAARAAVLRQLRDDPNRLPALVLCVCVALRLYAPLAALLQAKISE